MNYEKDKLLNVEQVRNFLQCSRRHVYSLVETGDLKALKIGGRQGLRIRKSVLEEFLKKREETFDV